MRESNPKWRNVRRDSINRNSGYIEGGRANAVLPPSQVEPFLKSLLQQNFRARTSEQFTQASLDYLHVRCSAAELKWRIVGGSGLDLVFSPPVVGEAGQRFNLPRLRLCLPAGDYSLLSAHRPSDWQEAPNTASADGHCGRLCQAPSFARSARAVTCPV